MNSVQDTPVTLQSHSREILFSLDINVEQVRDDVIPAADCSSTVLLPRPEVLGRQWHRGVLSVVESEVDDERTQASSTREVSDKLQNVGQLGRSKSTDTPYTQTRQACCMIFVPAHEANADGKASSSVLWPCRRDVFVTRKSSYR